MKTFLAYIAFFYLIYVACRSSITPREDIRRIARSFEYTAPDGTKVRKAERLPGSVEEDHYVRGFRDAEEYFMKQQKKK